VRAITQIIRQKRQEFDGITVLRVATLLWHIFMGAHHFFSTSVDLSGSLPESNLRVAPGMIETTMIPEQVNVPYEQQLFGATPPEEGLGGGGKGTDGQDPWESARSPGKASAPVEQRNFNRILGTIKTALSGVRPSTRRCKWLT
jgi:hypothetical protein